jgi:DNA-binding transcriptional LysR family regulator
MDTRRLQLLLALSRLGSMRAVADVHHLTTSTVSAQIAALARETGAQLIEPDGRRVRLTPAGQRLADHAVTILAAIDSARLDLDPDAEPSGTVRVGGFATGLRVSLLPLISELAERYPEVEFVISEYEPIEVFALLTDDDLDLALTYDYNLAPASPGAALETIPLWSVEWGLAVPTESAARGKDGIGAFADRTWIVNSRNTADESAVRTLASLAGFVPRIAHQIDSLDLVEDLVVAGYGVGLLPIGRPTQRGVTVLELADPKVVLTAYAATRRGRSTWPPLRAVLDRLRPAPGAPLPWPAWPRPTAAP